MQNNQVSDLFLKQLSVFAKSLLKNKNLTLKINGEGDSFYLTHYDNIVEINGYNDSFLNQAKGMLDLFAAKQFYKISSLPTTSNNANLLQTLIYWRAFKLLTHKFAGSAKNIKSYKNFELANRGVDAQNSLETALESFLYNIKHPTMLLFSNKANDLILAFKKQMEDSHNSLYNEEQFLNESLAFINNLQNLVENKQKLQTTKNTVNGEARKNQKEEKQDKNDNNEEQEGDKSQTENKSSSVHENWDDDLSEIANFIEQNKLKNKNNPKGEQDDANQVSKRKRTTKIKTDDFKYKIFTTQFDKICNIKELSTNEKENAQIKQHFLLDLKKQASIAKKDINKLMQKLSSASKVNYIYDTDEGRLDSKKFRSLIIKKSSEALFYKRQEIKNNDIAVSILVDNSGSMRGRLIKISSIACYLLSQALGKINIPTEVLGFTTANWQGGESFKMYQDLEHKPQIAGRVSDCLHVIYKSFSQKNSQTNLLNIALMQKDSLLKENIDGEALDWAYKRLLKQKAKRKILIVISDGTPIDDSTVSLNGKDYLQNHLYGVVSNIERSKQVSLVAIGIMHNVGKFYTNATQINSVDELSSTLITKLIKVL